MKNTAVITGASGGLGREFARLFAKDGYNLILAARNGEKLQKLKEETEKEYGVTAEIFTCDLSETETPEKLFAFCKEKQAEIAALVNNAGFGDFGEFYRSDLTDGDGAGERYGAYAAYPSDSAADDCKKKRKDSERRFCGGVCARSADERILCDESVCAFVYGSACRGDEAVQREHNGALPRSDENGIRKRGGVGKIGAV